MFSGESWKNTPLITGRRSSFPVAKMVLLSADANAFPLISKVEGFSIAGTLGNSSYPVPDF